MLNPPVQLVAKPGEYRFVRSRDCGQYLGTSTQKQIDFDMRSPPVAYWSISATKISSLACRPSCAGRCSNGGNGLSEGVCAPARRRHGDRIYRPLRPPRATDDVGAWRLAQRERHRA